MTGTRQWIPQEHIDDPVTSLVMAGRWTWRSEPRVASHRSVHGYVPADGLAVQLGLQGRGVRQLHPVAGLPRGPRQGYVLRVRSNFHLALAVGTTMTCAELPAGFPGGQAAPGGPLRRESVRGRPLLCLGVAWHSLHLTTGQQAFCYRCVPEGQAATKTRLIRAAGLRWPVARSSGHPRGHGPARANLAAPGPRTLVSPTRTTRANTMITQVSPQMATAIPGARGHASAIPP